MSRTAEHSIAGYVYQALKSLIEILQAQPGDFITIEGLIEDIDHSGNSGVRAIQCKYHAQKTDFQLSYIYKPIIQMWSHYCDNQSSDVEYILYSHFPCKSGIEKISKEQFDQVISTKDQTLVKLISKITTKGDKYKFLQKLSIEFGPSLDDLTETTIGLLVNAGFTKEDAESIILPASIHIILDHAIQKSPSERIIERNAFVYTLRSLRADAIYRWTRELKTKKQTYDRAKNALRDRLSQGTRKRVMIINSSYIDDFDDRCVEFIRSFVLRYLTKPHIHINAPTFLLDDACDIESLEERLFALDVRVHNGKVGNRFDINRFCEESIWDRTISKCSYHLRMTRLSYAPEFADRLRPDDIFTIHSSYSPNNSDMKTIRLDIPSFADLAYIFNIGGFHA